MCVYFTKTAIGANHIKKGTPCQDHSASYHDEERTIVTVCDGHGGALYVRSDRGSRFASAAVIAAFQQIGRLAFRKRGADLAEVIRVRIISEWNDKVKCDLAAHPIRVAELKGLTERQIEAVREDPFKAYGTTLNGAMFMKNKLVCVSLGDGGVFLCKKGGILPVFAEDDEQVANLTHSLCEEDAGKNLHVAIFDTKDWDGVLLGTDGLINPYGDLENFSRSLVLPAVKKLANREYDLLSQFVKELGQTMGTGDDVSLALLYREKQLRKYSSGR